MTLNVVAGETSLSGTSRNLILSRMPKDHLEEMSKHLVPVTLPIGMRLGTPNRQQRYAYFPISGLISVDALTESGSSVEVGLVGREGFVGLAGLLGQPQTPNAVLVQAAGSGFRVPLSLFRDQFLRGGVVADLIHQYAYLHIVQLAQSVLCNRLHPIECRMARWMLTASDRTETNQLGLTQEFLAQMLGSRRSTVTVAAGNLQSAGIIEYARGKVTILDRARLEAVSCECYGIVKACYARVLGSY